MSPEIIFDVHLLLGYFPWLLFCGAYFWPRIGAMDPVAVHRGIAMLHSFRFFGLVFIVPGFVGPNLSAGFAEFAAYGDFATGLLAMLAFATVRIRSLFWAFVVAFNVVGTVDIVVDYVHGVQLGIAASAGELGGGYAIIILYVPLLLITHATAFVLLLRSRARSGVAARPMAGAAR